MQVVVLIECDMLPRTCLRDMEIHNFLQLCVESLIVTLQGGYNLGKHHIGSLYASQFLPC